MQNHSYPFYYKHYHHHSNDTLTLVVSGRACDFRIGETHTNTRYYHGLAEESSYRRDWKNGHQIEAELLNEWRPIKEYSRIWRNPMFEERWQEREREGERQTEEGNANRFQRVVLFSFLSLCLQSWILNS